MPSGHICFSSPRRERHHPGAIALIFLLATGALAGCSMTDGIGSYIVDPGEYHVFHCDDLKKRLATLLDQQKELSNFINKASESAGGVIIGTLSYRSDYEIAIGREKLLRRTAAEKKCELPPPASAASPSATTFQSDQVVH